MASFGRFEEALDQLLLVRSSLSFPSVSLNVKQILSTMPAIDKDASISKEEFLAFYTPLFHALLACCFSLKVCPSSSFHSFFLLLQRYERTLELCKQARSFLESKEAASNPLWILPCLLWQAKSQLSLGRFRETVSTLKACQAFFGDQDRVEEVQGVVIEIGESQVDATSFYLAMKQQLRDRTEASRREERAFRKNLAQAFPRSRRSSKHGGDERMMMAINGSTDEAFASPLHQKVAEDARKDRWLLMALFAFFLFMLGELLNRHTA